MIWLIMNLLRQPIDRDIHRALNSLKEEIEA